MNLLGTFLIATMTLCSACTHTVREESQLDRFWRNHPGDQNVLAMAGYERSFAMRATPELIDQMIIDLRRRPSELLLERYALIIYYMPRPASTDHLAALRQSHSKEISQLAERLNVAITSHTRTEQRPPNTHSPSAPGVGGR